MQKKASGWKTKGMNRDMSVSAFNAEFAFENVNIRISTNSDNTLLSWVNERGPAEITLTNIDTAPWLGDGEIPLGRYESVVKGYVIGTAVINHKLVLFTHETLFGPSAETNNDRIYVLWYTDDAKTTMTGKKLFQGHLNFNANYPLETLVSYEAEYIQKVYWTDGLNQPRLINIMEDKDKLYTWNSDTQPFKIATYFDFLPAFEEDEGMQITQHISSSGTFAPGVIQYCFTYINKYGQQTNIVKVSPLYYLGYADRGASPEDRVTCTFEILIDGVDHNFDYVRLYSIQNTSVNTDPIVKLLSDLEIKSYIATVDNEEVTKYKVTFTDNGTTGSIIDPYELLYAGGREITALTMVDKDSTLFMGNLKEIKSSVKDIQEYVKERNATGSENPIDIEFSYGKTLNLDLPNGLYPYSPVWNDQDVEGGLNQADVTSFKGGETYRFGFQLQKHTGEWSEPIFIKDAENPLYPKYIHDTTNYEVALSTAAATINLYRSGEDDWNSMLETYMRIRPVIVYPNIQDRTVVAQGVVNPTVFNIEDRMDNSPYSQASWFFRPYIRNLEDNVTNKGALKFEHYASLGTGKFNTEIQGYAPIVTSVFSTIDAGYKSGDKLLCNNMFFIDHSIVTVNSPEIEFDSIAQLSFIQDMKFRIIGMIPITSNRSSYSLESSTAMLALGHHDETDNWVPGTTMPNGLPYFIPNTTTFGNGNRGIKVGCDNLSAEAQGSGRRLCAAYLWNDAFVYHENNDKDNVNTSYLSFNWVIYPWHKNGSFNNDPRNQEEASSFIKTKKEATLLYSFCTDYFNAETGLDSTKVKDYENIISKICLTENAEVFNYRLDNQIINGVKPNYYPNVDKLLYNLVGYHAEYEPQSFAAGSNAKATYDKDTGLDGSTDHVPHTFYTPVHMKYKSTSHAVVAFKQQSYLGSIPILPWAWDGTVNMGKWTTVSSRTYWGEDMTFQQEGIDISSSEFNLYPILWLGELYKEVSNRFGSDTDDPKKNAWVIAGDAVSFNRTGDNVITWNWGDTFFQRYDCLKTYAFSDMDTNQIVEILSFMCETHVNLDGRYDKQRGQLKNYNMNPTVFNLINPAYSQQNNFFTYKQLDVDEQDTQSYPNQITFSKSKTSGEDVDLWTNVTLASTIEMDGDKGQVTSLQRFNDSLIAFQDSGISQILYNENVQISSENGVPIEIANSGKVQGKRYFSDTVGCSNKWSIVQSPQGIYFMDSNNKGIYLFNGQLNNLSSAGGMNTWSKENIPSSEVIWSPTDAFPAFVSYYDRQNNDVMFINKDTSLHYSERVGAFTSFYDYGKTPYFDNLDDTGIWSRHSVTSGSSAQAITKLYKQNAGEYCNFFGTNKPYSMTLVGNAEPQLDKLFTNLEFRAVVDGEGNFEGSPYAPYTPFDYLETWNEYQHGIANMSYKNGHGPMRHHLRDENKTAHLNRKFRIWRCDIPRDNAPLSSTTENPMKIFRSAVRPLDRMRNPWLYIKLQKKAAESGTSLPRTEIHDMMMYYFI